MESVLKAGMLANVRVWRPGVPPGLLVPKDAIVLGGPSTVVVFVVKRVGEKKRSLERVEMVPVQLGLADQDWIQVQGPLAAGDRVVVQVIERLRPGQMSMLPEPSRPQWVELTWTTRIERRKHDTNRIFLLQIR